MTKWSLMMDQIKDSIFCLSDISMSKLFGGKVCFNPLAGWLPTGIICANTEIYSFCKSHYRLPWICSMHFPVLALFHKMNSNPGTATVLHVLLVNALLLTFDSYWGKRELADAVAFLLGLQLQHTLIYTVAGWKACSGHLQKWEVKETSRYGCCVWKPDNYPFVLCVLFSNQLLWTFSDFFFYKLNNSFEQSEPKRSICQKSTLSSVLTWQLFVAERFSHKW